MQDACISLEKARDSLYLAYDKALRNLPKVEYVPLLAGDNVDVKYENNVIKVHVPDYMPLTGYLSSDAKNRWIGRINYAIQSLFNIPDWEKIFVYIIESAPGENWDIDNRNIKTIIDAVRYSRIVKDDNICYLAYGAEGICDTCYYTDIYIFDYYKLGEILPKIIENRVCKKWVK